MRDTPLPLAVRLPNWVGDVCMALPTLHALAVAGFAPHLVGRRWAASLLAGSGWPVTEAGKGIRSGARSLRATGARHGLLLTNSLGTALAMRLAGIEAIGYRGEGRGLLLATACRKEPGRHEVEQFFALGRACRARWRAQAPWPEQPGHGTCLTPSAEARELVAAQLAQAGMAEDFVVLCPMAVGSTAGQPKVWPSWRSLAARLHALGRPLVACPGPGEAAECANVAPEALQLPGLDLDAYAALLERASLVIANDSGPMHLAAAVGCPVLGIFGPGDPDRTAPWGGSAIGGHGQWPGLDEVLERITGQAPRRLTRPEL